MFLNFGFFGSLVFHSQLRVLIAISFREKKKKVESKRLQLIVLGIACFVGFGIFEETLCFSKASPRQN